jgi:glutaredoxin
MRSAVALFLLVGLVPGATADKVYKWTDETGKVHYSNTPPGGGAQARELELRIPTYEGEAEISTANAVGRGVTLYTTSTCGYCKKAIAYLRKRSIPFTEYDVEKSATGKLDYRRLNGRGVPIILVGNQRMDGFNETRLADMLKRAGY